MLIEDEEMPERTLTQVINELEQVRAKITDLDVQLSSQRQKAKELADELVGMASDVLPSGYTMQITAKDGTPAGRGKSKSTSKKEGPSTKELRAWAADTGYTLPEGKYKGKPVSDWPNRIPDEDMALLIAAHNQAQ